jgi:hypothetical protein
MCAPRLNYCLAYTILTFVTTTQRVANLGLSTLLPAVHVNVHRTPTPYVRITTSSVGLQPTSGPMSSVAPPPTVNDCS